MQSPVIFKEEEKIVFENLLKVGLSNQLIEEKLRCIKNSCSENKPLRNIVIKEITDIMKSKKCALQPWYIYDVVSKISGLSPNYIQIISNTNNPDKILKKNHDL